MTQMKFVIAATALLALAGCEGMGGSANGVQNDTMNPGAAPTSGQTN